MWETKSKASENTAPIEPASEPEKQKRKRKSSTGDSPLTKTLKSIVQQ